MLAQIIRASLRQPYLVLLILLIVLGLGVKSLQTTPIDAIPNLGDVQVIVKVTYPGQAPEIIEQQVTYPISSLLMSVPGSQTVRGFSFFGDAYLYVIFEENTNPYWARSRVLEYLNQIQASLPTGASMQLGPDASGVGWIFQYVLKDTTNQHHLADLTRIQDWFVRQELQSVAGVSEVAKVGGMVQTYQVVIEPAKLLQHQLSITQVHDALIAANGEVGGGVIELAEAEYIVRSKGYLTQLEAFSTIPIGYNNSAGTPLLLKDIATIRLGPQTRRGVAEYNGKGEVVGGIVIMRDGENALAVIKRVKAKLETIRQALPQGVEIDAVYDRTTLITNTIDHLSAKLLQEMLVVVILCGLFLMHLRATIIIAVCLPCALLIGFLLMDGFDVNANLMSLAGIAIAIGALVDAAIVMVENVQKHLASTQGQITKLQRYRIVSQACIEVGPALFISLLIITLSFLPIFALNEQAGRLFTPLAFTKTVVMASAALLSVTVVPVLALFLMKGAMISEERNLLVRMLQGVYRKILTNALLQPYWIIVVSGIFGLSVYYPLSHMGSEFMPQFNEGDLLYMPTTLPGVSVREAGEILQQTDRLIKTVPEVLSVFGKVGRADTSTDPAPMTMIETTIQLKPKGEWRTGITLNDIIQELDSKVRFPGLTNAWVQPIKTRIDMLSTGVRTRIGVKLLADDIPSINAATTQVEAVVATLPGTRSVIGERPLSGRYIDIIPNRNAMAQYGLNLKDIQNQIAFAVAGQTVDSVVKGRERFPINLRYPRQYRDRLETIKRLPFVTPSGAWVSLEQVADININAGPSLIRSENARALGWVFIEVEANVSLGQYASELNKALSNENLPPKVTWSVAGQYQYLHQVKDTLTWVVPTVVLVVLVLLQLLFKRWWQSLIILATLPIAMSAALWFAYLLGYHLSVALIVGVIALVGVAAEFGVVMMLYLNTSWRSHNGTATERILQGAIQRVRPKAMTVLTIIASLLPIMLGEGVGNEVMQRIAAPMLGGMIVCPLISMILIPVVYHSLASNVKTLPNRHNGNNNE